MEVLNNRVVKVHRHARTDIYKLGKKIEVAFKIKASHLGQTGAAKRADMAQGP